MDHFVCVGCQTKFWSVVNPNECSHCGGKTVLFPTGTDAPGMLHYIEAEIIKEAFERDVIEVIAAFEERLRRESEVDKYGGEGKDLPGV